MELHPELPQPRARGRMGAMLGLACGALLYAAFQWAHHCGALADSIVAGACGAG